MRYPKCDGKLLVFIGSVAKKLGARGVSMKSVQTENQISVSFYSEIGSMKSYVLVAVVMSSVFAIGVSAQDKAKGQKLYNEYCKTCHQETGKGLGSVYPPLAGSDYLKTKSKAEVIKVVTGGLKGEITVNGKKFNGVMAPLPAKYTDQDVADILTYVYGSWGNNGTKAAGTKK
jgi:mono/diheme cytochrome c family protein